MQKIYLFLFAVAAAFTSTAQTIPNGDMEIWRSNTAGSSPAMNIFAPFAWYGFDSTIIEDGQAFGGLVGAGNDWKAQLFEESTITHGGAAAAKIVTVKQDTFGHLGGIMSNSKIDLDLTSIIGGGDPLSAITFSGGTATSLRIMNVSAWVEYLPGIDSMTGLFGGNDTGSITVQAICTAYGADSVIGMGAMDIYPSSSFTQITAPVAYIDTYSTCDLVRIIFTSSKLGGPSLDSSILYVDDVTMTGIAQHSHVAASHVKAEQAIVSLYPNPTSGMLYVNSPQNSGLSVTILSVSGQIVATHALNGHDTVDMHELASGAYVYAITDAKGNTVQQGKVTKQ